MIAFLVRRTLFLALVVLGALAVVFALAYVIPADPARAALGQDASEEQVRAYRQQMGLDDPFWLQFLRYVSRLTKGDLGTSIVTGNRVADDLREAVPATIELIIPSIGVSLLLGVVLGTVCAVRRGRMLDHAGRVLSILGMSLPVFWFGLVLQLVFYIPLLPRAGRQAADAGAGRPRHPGAGAPADRVVVFDVPGARDLPGGVRLQPAGGLPPRRPGSGPRPGIAVPD